jgi:hypothetical protein
MRNEYESQFNNWDTVLVRQDLRVAFAALSSLEIWLHVSADLVRRRAIHDIGPAGLLSSQQIQMVH